jgi:hypothetical protein
LRWEADPKKVLRVSVVCHTAKWLKSSSTHSGE